MVEQRASEFAVVTGSSIHNQRIERLWRYACMNEVDIFCLHQVYLPRVNDFLHQFAENWNNLSSEHSQTPNQLFIEGIVAQQQIQPQLAVQPDRLQHPDDSIVVQGGNFQACSAFDISLHTFFYPVDLNCDLPFPMQLLIQHISQLNNSVYMHACQYMYNNQTPLGIIIIL